MLRAILAFLTSLYEIENKIMSDHLRFNFNQVEGFASQFADVPFLLCGASYPRS